MTIEELLDWINMHRLWWLRAGITCVWIMLAIGFDIAYRLLGLNCPVLAPGFGVAITFGLLCVYDELKERYDFWLHRAYVPLVFRKPWF